jgi:hypothetical protein
MTFTIPSQMISIFFQGGKKHLSGGESSGPAPAQAPEVLKGGSLGASVAFAGASVLPERPRLIVGGSTTLDVGAVSHSDKKTYVVVDSAGIPVEDKSGKKIYEASSPAAAARKAFTAWYRKTGKVTCGSNYSIPQSLAVHLRSKNLDHLAGAYLEEFSKIHCDQINKKLLVRIAEIGRNNVRTYLVSYLPNLTPNATEIKFKIVANAHAEYLKPTDSFPDNSYILERII